tara:strand:- start:1467 stop:2180 length:714 start_codon:yes stop_codon:yes gene_type:complete
VKKFIFDVDGTLTPSRKKIEHEFWAPFLIFCRHHDVYLVTGSDRQKTLEQLGLDICYTAKRVYNCSGCDVYDRDVNVYRDTWEPSDEVRQFLQDELDYSQFMIRTDPHIEERPGCINFSILGRGANWTEREVYKEWDKDEHERESIARRFNKRFPDLYATVGGQTGLDIAPIGGDKSQILRDFNKDDELHFFGDRMEEEGNDYSLAKAVKKMGGYPHHVSDWKDTRTKLVELTDFLE